MNKQLLNWLIFAALSFIWGSSFILMLLGMKHLSAYQVAAIRILSAGIVLLPVTIKHIWHVPVKKILLLFFCGALGNLVPAFLFCLAEEGIDSSLVGTLNSLTPIFVIITGAIFFNLRIPFSKIMGIVIALTGSILLLLSKGSLQGNQNLMHVSFVVLATIMYGLNVNIVHTYLQDIGSLKITAIALSLNAIPALLILTYTGFFNMPMNNKAFVHSVGAASILGIVGTAIATYIFYVLVKRAGGLFATMVTYGIPVVAIGWGILLGEKFGIKQVGCLLIMLGGVYWANRKTND